MWNFFFFLSWFWVIPIFSFRILGLCVYQKNVCCWLLLFCSRFAKSLMAWLFITGSLIVLWVASLIKIFLHGSFSPSKDFFLSSNGGFMSFACVRFEWAYLLSFWKILFLFIKLVKNFLLNQVEILTRGMSCWLLPTLMTSICKLWN